MKLIKRLSVGLTVGWLSACTVVYNQPANVAPEANSPPQETRPVIESDNQGDDWRPSNLAESIRACRAVGADNEIPIACEFTYHEGAPMMAVGFPDIDTVEAYSDAVTTYVGAPFCDSANNANRQAYLFLIVQSANMGNIFSCENQDNTGWFDLDLLDDF